MGSKGVLYYNVSASPLPQNATPQLRAGANRWETLLSLDMQQAEGIDVPQSDWWCIELEFNQVNPADVCNKDIRTCM